MLMDIIVTTPKSQMANAAREAADAIEAGGGRYFRRFYAPINISPGDRVYYVEDGYVRGFAEVCETEHIQAGKRCETTNRHWPPGFYVCMNAASWKWIEPIEMRGFQNYHIAHDPVLGRGMLIIGGGFYAKVKVVGGWLDPKPSAASVKTVVYKPEFTEGGAG